MITGCSDQPGLAASVKVSGRAALTIVANNFASPLINLTAN